MADTTPEKKPHRLKKFWREHGGEVIVGSFWTVVLTTYGYVLVKSYKDANQAVDAYNKWAADTNKWIVETSNAGNRVYSLDDGSYLVAPNDAPVERVIK